MYRCSTLLVLSKHIVMYSIQLTVVVVATSVWK